MTDPSRPGHSPGVSAALPAPSVRRGRAGGPSFEEIFKDSFDFVWSGLRHLGLPEASVDDAVQEVFLVVHRRLDDFEGRSALKTWLYGIMLRVAHDYRRKVRRAGQLEPIPEGLVDARPGPHEVAARSESLRLLEKLLSGLDEAKRDVLVLADMERLTAPEISEILGVPANTVYSRLRAAREQFNAAVAEYQRGNR